VIGATPGSPPEMSAHRGEERIGETVVLAIMAWSLPVCSARAGDVAERTIARADFLAGIAGLEVADDPPLGELTPAHPRPPEIDSLIGSRSVSLGVDSRVGSVRRPRRYGRLLGGPSL